MARLVRALPFWASANMDGKEKAFVQLGASLLRHESIKGLSPNAYRLYTYMIAECRGNREFRLPYSVCQDFISKPSFYKAIAELSEMGFVENIKTGYTPGTPNTYKFSMAYRDHDKNTG